MGILWIVVPGFVVGYAMMEAVRSIFSEDRTLVRRLFGEQPVTMTAAATGVGSVVVWGVLTALGVF